MSYHKEYFMIFKSAVVWKINDKAGNFKPRDIHAGENFAASRSLFVRFGWNSYFVNNLKKPVRQDVNLCCTSRNMYDMHSEKVTKLLKEKKNFFEMIKPKVGRFNGSLNDRITIYEDFVIDPVPENHFADFWAAL